jgi:hypothetical protein
MNALDLYSAPAAQRAACGKLVSRSSASSEAIPPAYARFVAESFLRWSNAKIDSNQLECAR